MKTRRGRETLVAQIAEMTTEAAGGSFDIQIDAEKVKKILARDSDPMFVTLQIAREGVSKNGRRYSADTMQQIADQINDKHPDAYKGHLSDAERATKTPDPETVWLGATVMEDKDGRTAVYAKGYVMPYAKKRRTILQTAADLGKNVAVSIFGTAKGAKYSKEHKAYDIEGIDIESVDWARPGSEGIPNDGTLILAAEMHNAKNNDPQEDDMTREEVLQTATADELAQHNPTLVQEMADAAITDATAPLVKIGEMVGADDENNAEARIAEMQTELSGYQLGEALNKRVASRSARPVIKKMVLAEMKSGESIDSTVERVLQTSQAQAIIKETAGNPHVNPTNDAKSQPTARKFTNVRK